MPWRLRSSKNTEGTPRWGTMWSAMVLGSRWQSTQMGSLARHILRRMCQSLLLYQCLVAALYRCCSLVLLWVGHLPLGTRAGQPGAAHGRMAAVGMVLVKEQEHEHRTQHQPHHERQHPTEAAHPN